MASKRGVVEDFQARLRAYCRPENHQELNATHVTEPFKRGLDFMASSQSDIESEVQRQLQLQSSPLNFSGPNTSNLPMESQASPLHNLMGSFEAFLNLQRQQFMTFLKTVLQDPNSCSSEGGNPLINYDLKPSLAICHSESESSQRSESESSHKSSNEGNYISVLAPENIPEFLSPVVRIERMNFYPASGEYTKGKQKSQRQACDVRLGYYSKNSFVPSVRSKTHTVRKSTNSDKNVKKPKEALSGKSTQGMEKLKKKSALHSRRNLADSFESTTDFQCGVKTRSQKRMESISTRQRGVETKNSGLKVTDKAGRWIISKMKGKNSPAPMKTNHGMKSLGKEKTDKMILYSKKAKREKKAWSKKRNDNTFVTLGGGSKEAVAEEPFRLRSGRVMQSRKEFWVPAPLPSTLKRGMRFSKKGSH